MRGMARLIVPGAVFVLLVAASSVDGFFRDEFYYLACTRHLAWGYVDQPPLSIALLWLIRLVAGDSLIVLRIAAAAAAAGAVWMTGSIARRIGAGPFGELLAMIAMAIVPEVLADGSFYSMNIIELFMWTAIVHILIDAIDEPSDRRWILLGVLLGLGLQNKISVLWRLGAGIGVGLLLTPSWRLLLTRGPWMAGAIAGVILLPHVLWQITHGWPTLEFIRNASRDKMQVNTAAAFLADQFRNMQPLTFPIWFAGLLALLFAPTLKRYRMLAFIFLTVTGILIVNRTSRSVYLLPAYPMLFAAGGIWWERHVRSRAIRTATLVVVLALGRVSDRAACHPRAPRRSVSPLQRRVRGCAEHGREGRPRPVIAVLRGSSGMGSARGQHRSGLAAASRRRPAARRRVHRQLRRSGRDRAAGRIARIAGRQRTQQLLVVGTRRRFRGRADRAGAESRTVGHAVPRRREDVGDGVRRLHAVQPHSRFSCAAG